MILPRNLNKILNYDQSQKSSSDRIFSLWHYLPSNIRTGNATAVNLNSDKKQLNISNLNFKIMKHFSFFKSFLTVLLMAVLQMSASAQVTLMSVDDGTAFKEMPDTTATNINEGNIFVYKTDSTEAIAYVKFEISKFQGKIVSEAIFSTRAAMKADDKTMMVSLVDAKSTDFTRDSLTWNHKPGTGSELATAEFVKSSARLNYTSSGTKLADFINQALAQGKQYIAFAIKFKSGDGGDFSWAGGTKNGAYGPMLTLSFDEGFNYWAVADGVAFKEKPDTTATWKGATNIYIWKTDTTEAIAYVKFKLPGFAYKTISSAEFSTRSDVNDGKTMTVALKDAKSVNFTRNTLKWSNKPGVGAELATVLMDQESNRKTYTPTGTKLIDYINGVLATGSEEIAFALTFKDGNGGDFKWAGGVGDGAYGPMLMVTEGMNAAGYATDDGFATQNFPDSTANAFKPTNLLISKSSDTTEQIAYIKFDISAFSGRQVENVKFSTRAAMATDGKTMTVGLYDSKSTDFTRSTLNWNNKPGTGNELATVIMEKSSARKYYVSTGTKLVDYVNEKLMQGKSEIAFALKYKDGDGADFGWCGGKGDAAYGPLLEMEFGYGSSSYAIADGSGFQEKPDTTANWKGATNIFVYKTDTTQGIAYVKFDISALGGKAISKATFSTRSSMKAEGKSMTVSLVDAKSIDFTRSELTWNQRPATGNELATVVMEKTSTRKEYIPNGTKLVDFINGKLAAMDSEIAFALKYKEGDGGDFSWCGGAGDGAYGPMLVMELEKPVTIDTITVIEDAYVLEAYPDSTGEGIAAMQIGKDNANNDAKQTYIKFPIEGAAYPVGKATLVLKGDVQGGAGAGAYPFKIQILGTDNSWAEDTLDWNNKPADNSSVLADYEINASALHEVTADMLTHYINEAIKAEQKSVSFAIKGKDDTGDNHAWVSSKEWVPATFILDYTVAPPVQESKVIEDTYVSQVEGEQENNFGTEADQHLINDGDNAAGKMIFFKYDLSKAYENPVSATLKLYGSIHSSATGISEFEYQIFAGATTWSEDTTTWKNKPAVESTVLLEGTLATSGKWYELSSPAFNQYIINAVKEGKQQITLVAKGKVKTPGNRAWISGKEWRASSILLNYEPQVEPPVLTPVPGEYISSVQVEIKDATPNASIYYTLDGSEPSDASTMYSGKITLTETTTINAIAYADELKPSLITMGEYIVHPVGIPEFFPSPMVTYTDDNAPVVTIKVEPADAIIYFSDDGSDPATPYPTAGIPLTSTTTIKAQAYSADGENSSEIIEATYVVEATVEGFGDGPAGIGYADVAISGQPEKALWLMADKITGKVDGDTVGTWMDYSGKMNNATDKYTGKNLTDKDGNKVYANMPSPAPKYLAEGINGLPALNFGDANSLSSLVIPDENAKTGAQDFDGIGGFSMWLVLKRNVANGDWQSILQKRDDQTSKTWSWIFEFNGGGDKDKPTLTIEQGSNFVGGAEAAITSTEEAYIIGADYRDFDRASQWMNGKMTASKLYAKPIIDNNAFVVIGDAVKANIGEIVFFKNGLNTPQKVILQNYLATKYNVDISAAGIAVYDGMYTNELIGVGKAMYGDKIESHAGALGAGLQLTQVGSTFQADEYVFAAHNGMANSDDNASKTWARRWYIQTSEGASVDVKLGFDFATAGLTTPASADGYAVWYSEDGETFAAMESAGTLEGDVMSFNVPSVANGYYVLSKGEVTAVRNINNMNDLVDLYPNPTSQNANVLINNQFDGNFRINIYNLTGSVVKQIVSHKPAGPFTERFNVSDLTTGVYMVEVIQSNNRAVKRLIIK